MRTFEYIAVAALGLIFAGWLAITVATAVASSFAKVNATFEQVNERGSQ
jgi:hypothetical protein